MLVDRHGLRLYANGAIVVELDARADRYRRLDDDRVELGHLQLRPIDGLDALLLQRLFVNFGNELVERFVEKRFAAEVTLDHCPRRLPGAKPWDTRLVDNAPIG